MARQIRNNDPPHSTSQNWLEILLSKLNVQGAAIIVLFGVGGGCYQVGRTFMENEKKIEIYDLKISHEKDKDSLRQQIENLKLELKTLKSLNRKDVK